MLCFLKDERVNQDNLNREWIDLAPAWIREAREGENPTRTGLLDKPMLAACGDVKGLRVLDCGCGEGRFCRLLADRGAAYVLGLDLCGPMIEAAGLGVAYHAKPKTAAAAPARVDHGDLTAILFAMGYPRASWVLDDQ